MVIQSKSTETALQGPEKRLSERPHRFLHIWRLFSPGRPQGGLRPFRVAMAAREWPRHSRSCPIRVERAAGAPRSPAAAPLYFYPVFPCFPCFRRPENGQWRGFPASKHLKFPVRTPEISGGNPVDNIWAGVIFWIHAVIFWLVRGQTQRTSGQGGNHDQATRRAQSHNQDLR